jgi:hypothetical protein
MAVVEPPEFLPPAKSPADAGHPSVWMVDEGAGFELYSNGLRVETRDTVSGEKRPYPVYDSQTLELLEWGTGPVGIVFHSTESNLAPFEPGQNGRLRRLSQWLLDYVRREKAYHYVIDRFGSVHRVVRESDAANHAGYSVWADGRKLYVNLNPSFLGVSFESQTGDPSREPTVSEAQVHAARVLTEMLRAKYGVPARNCVTHAQVSVAPSTMRLGNHMDWAANFPFGKLGLTDSYAIPNPAVAVFGFEYDPDYLKAAGPELWKGVALGEDEFRQRAAIKGISTARLRGAMKSRYKGIIQALEHVVDAVEKTL